MDLDFIFHFISIVEIIKQGDNLRRISASKRVNDQSKVKKKIYISNSSFLNHCIDLDDLENP